MSDLRCYGDAVGARYLVRRHVDGPACTGDTCKGCRPCDRAHCYLCGKTHSPDVCGGCLTKIRNDIGTIRVAYRLLLAEALYGGSDGRLEAARPIPGGEAMVLLAPASGYDDGLPPEDEHPLRVLAVWSDRWRYWFGEPTDLRATIEREADYLDGNLFRIVCSRPRGDEYPPDVVEMVGEIERARSLLERVLHDEAGGYPAAPCPNCRTRLVRHVVDRIRVAECLGHGALEVCPIPRHQGCADLGGAGLYWECRGCGASYDAKEYETLVARDYLDNATALSAPDIERRTGIPASKVRVWSSRGHVRKRGKDAYNRVLYVVEDVERYSAGEIHSIP